MNIEEENKYEIMIFNEVILDLCVRSHNKNWFDSIQLGEYILTLSNAAVVFGKENDLSLYRLEKCKR